MKRIIPALVAGLLMLLSASGHALLDSVSFSDDLRRLTADGRSHDLPRLHPHTAEFYRQRDYRPLWLSQPRPGPAAAQLLQAVGYADRHGLNPNDYHAERLVTLLAVDGSSALLRARLELLLSDAFFTLAGDLLTGRLDPRRAHAGWPFQPRGADIDRHRLLEQAVLNADVQAVLARLEPPHPQYGRLKMALQRYRELAARDWPTLDDGPSLRLGSSGEQVKVLRARLQASGDLIPAAPPLPADEFIGEPYTALPDALFDDRLEQAVLDFQRRHGLETDGVVGPRTRAALNLPAAAWVRQLELNLERWRWLPDSLGERYILVNIAGYEMQLVEHGEAVFRSPVIVGRRDRQTPLLSSAIDRLVLSPYWHVPVNIAVKDKLPLLQRNPYALSKQRIRVFSNGRELDPGQVDWHGVGRGHFPYRLRQDPGPQNALGKVKFLFPNRYQVYLHDTSTPRLFGASRRSFSSGCVRVAKPLELAEHLLRDDPRWTAERIAAAGQKSRERAVLLEQTVPVHLLYWTAWLDDDGAVQFRDDIYRFDSRLRKTLVARR